jgi:hypothetical protein
MDDFLLFGDDKRQLHRWRAAVIEYLVRLRLTLHEGRAQVYPVHVGIPFLGFRVFPTHRRLKRRNGVNFQRRLHTLMHLLARQEIDVARLHAAVRGWVNHVRYGDTWGLRRTILGSWRLPSPPRKGRAGERGRGEGA